MKLIIFDVDGTLTDTKNVDDNCFIKAFKTVFGIEIKNQNWNKLKNVTDWGITEEIVEKNLDRLPTKQEYKQMINEFVRLLKLEIDNDISQFKAVEKAIAFFNYLQSKSEYKIGIATGGWEKSAKLKLEMIGIDIKGIAFSSSSKYKSREKIIKDVIQQLNGTTTDEILYFGDGEWDFNTCQKLEIKFIGIDINDNGKLSSLGANIVFKNFREKDLIIKILERVA